MCLEDFLWKTDIKNIDITSSTCQEDNVITDYLKIMIVQMGQAVTFWGSSHLEEIVTPFIWDSC